MEFDTKTPGAWVAASMLFDALLKSEVTDVRGWLTEPLYYDFQYSLLIIPCQALTIHQPYHHRIPVLPLDKQPTNKEAQDYPDLVFVRFSGFIVNNDATITGGESVYPKRWREICHLLKSLIETTPAHY